MITETETPKRAIVLPTNNYFSNFRLVEDQVPGYPRLAAFTSSETSSSLYRRFSCLRSRVLLELQHEIRCFEDNLADMDQDDFDEDPLRVRSIEFECLQAEGKDAFRKRSTLLNAIREKLNQYGKPQANFRSLSKLMSVDELLLRTNAINGLQWPSERDYNSVRAWFHMESPLENEKEKSYIKRRDGILTLRQGRQWTWFHYFIERIIMLADCPLVRVRSLAISCLARR